MPPLTFCHFLAEKVIQSVFMTFIFGWCASKLGCFEILVTNTVYSPEEFKNLYAYRWGIETSFHAKKKEGSPQETYAPFINFNVCKWLTSHVTIETSKLKQAYKICFQTLFMLVENFLETNSFPSNWKPTLPNIYPSSDLIEHSKER